MIEHQLNALFAFLADLPVFYNAAIGPFGGIVANKTAFGGGQQFNPVTGLYFSCCARTGLLLGQGLLKPGLIHSITGLRGNKCGKVVWKTKGIVEFKGFFAGNGSTCRKRSKQLIESGQTRFQGAQKGGFFLENHLFNKGLLLFQLRESGPQRLNQQWNQLMYKRLLQFQKTKAVANGPTQNAANYITGAGVGWQLPIGNGQRHCP